MDRNEYERISLKLIELVKPHETIYNEKSNFPKYAPDRWRLWMEISAEMNRAFGTEHRKCS